MVLAHAHGAVRAHVGTVRKSVMRGALEIVLSPFALIEWAKRKHLDLEGIANPEKYSDLYEPVVSTRIETTIQGSSASAITTLSDSRIAHWLVLLSYQMRPSSKRRESSLVVLLDRSAPPRDNGPDETNECIASTED